MFNDGAVAADFDFWHSDEEERHVAIGVSRVGRILAVAFTEEAIRYGSSLHDLPCRRSDWTMNDKHEDEDFEARFEREIDFSNAQPYPRTTRARVPDAPGVSDLHSVPDDGVETTAIKRKRVRRGA